VAVQALQRLADGLVFARQVDSSGELGRLQQLSTYSGRLDGLLSNPATSLSAPWTTFFGAAEGVVAEPGSQVARQAMIDAGDQLATRWRALDAQLTGVGREVDARMASQVEVANQLATEIARLNKDIVAGGSTPNPDLLDQRALRIEKLASLTGAEVVEQDDGAMNVFSGGQALVLGTRAGKLTLAPDPFAPERRVLSLDAVGGPVKLPPGALSGEIGGLLEFRDRVLEPARAELGRMATAFAVTFNAAQRAGVDYTGTAGADLFSVPAPRVDAHAANTGTGTLAASVSDVGALKGPDITLRFAGGTWSATRSSTGEPLALAGSGSAADPLRIEGVSLVVGGVPANGDRFELRPTSAAGGGIALVQRDPSRIAAASPIQTRVDAANLGNAKAAGARITDPAAFAGFSGATIDFIDATTYTIDNGPPIAWTPGTPIAGTGWSLSLDGAPVAGDTFTLARMPARSSDNGNARLMAGIDARGVLDGGTRDLTTGLSALTARAGSEARHAGMNLDAQQAIHDQAIADREATSGVNLDEEAADLLRYQQAYQAAAQVIATADTMFQTLLGAVRR
jgi:flagellar hook-associated protein 1 FlgK